MVGREARPSDLEVDIRNDSFWFVWIAADAGAKGLWTRARCIRNTRGLRFNRSGKNDPRNTRTGTRIARAVGLKDSPSSALNLLRQERYVFGIQKNRLTSRFPKRIR